MSTGVSLGRSKKRGGGHAEKWRGHWPLAPPVPPPMMLIRTSEGNDIERTSNTIILYTITYGTVFQATFLITLIRTGGK